MSSEAHGELLASLNVRVADAVMLFDALNVDGNEAVEIDEFVMGYMRLTEYADTLNVMLVLKSHTKLIQQSLKMTAAMGKSIVALGTWMEKISAVQSPQSFPSSPDLHDDESG